jgi:SAM-dependent methyltransferase
MTLESQSLSRAISSKGISNDDIYRAVARALEGRALGENPLLVDVGCGRGFLWNRLKPYFSRYIGVDVFRHPDFPPERELILHDLSNKDIPLPDGCADVGIACDVNPQLENPRLLFREVVRLVKPGGWVIVTNPNPLSLLSLLTLLTRQRFNAFQDSAYPLMITPVLEVDLLRMAQENNLIAPEIFYTYRGRVPFTTAYYPQAIAKAAPRLFSDQLGIIARKPL